MEVRQLVHSVAAGEQTLAHVNGFRKAGATTGVQDAERVPFGLLKRLLVGDVRNLLLGEPSLERGHLDSLHVALLEPWLHHGSVRLGKGQNMAIGLIKEIYLGLLGVSRGDEEDLVRLSAPHALQTAGRGGGGDSLCSRL